MKRLALLGASGSIGQNVLDVVRRHPDDFRIACLSVHTRKAFVFESCLDFCPDAVCFSGCDLSQAERRTLEEKQISVYCGTEGIRQMLAEQEYDLLVNALVGAVGLLPTLEAIRRGKSVALANKETLVMAGHIVTAEARRHGVDLIPIDSEHSAVFQCLLGESIDNVRRIILTGSGGPFLHRDLNKFDEITVEEALCHPNWRMGKKITIDSATLMNKGLEVIEAHWLFGLPLEKIEVIIHPQSIIHSLVEFVDGSVKAQLGWPDMRHPIQFALTYPGRKPFPGQPLDLASLKELTFLEPDEKRFPAFKYALEAIRTGGTMPAVMNAANEVAVQLFLEGKIAFPQIPQLIRHAMDQHQAVAEPSLETVLDADRWARDFVKGHWPGLLNISH